MGSKYLYRRANRGATPLRLQSETPMPPDQVTCLPGATGIFHYGLSVRCVPRKGLTIYWTAPCLRQGPVVVRNKYGGYWNKTRSMVDSGGLRVPCMVSITIIFQTNRQQHHSSCPTMPYWVYSSQRNTSISSCLLKTRGFSGFLPVGIRSIRGGILPQA
jgi:hypothetical protein